VRPVTPALYLNSGGPASSSNLPEGELEGERPSGLLRRVKCAPRWDRCMIRCMSNVSGEVREVSESAAVYACASEGSEWAFRQLWLTSLLTDSLTY
jgi:hypothetical protein